MDAMETDGLRILRFDLAGESATCGEGAGDFGPGRMAGVDDILEDAIHGIFIEDAQIPVGVDVHFECLKLKAFFVRHVMQRDGAEIRQICFGTNGCVLWNLDRDLVAFILVRKSFDFRQWGINTTPRMPLVVTQFRCFLFSTCRFTLHALRLTSSTVVSSNPFDRFFLIR